MSQAPTNAEKFAFTQGVLFGVLLGLYQAITFLFTMTVEAGRAILIVNIASIIVSLATYIFVGVRTSQRTGKVTTGLLTGLWTGLFGSLLYFWTLIAAVLTPLRYMVREFLYALGVDLHYTGPVMIIVILIYGTILVSLGTTFGLGFGALGGLIGKRRATTTQNPAS